MTYPTYQMPPDDGPGPEQCGREEHISWAPPTDLNLIGCLLRKGHSGSHVSAVPIHGRARVDLKPEYGGKGAGTVHMRGWFIWDEPTA